MPGRTEPADPSVGGLARIGEVALVGLLAFVCSLPLITITAAQAAAFRTLDPRFAGRPAHAALFLRSFRDQLRRGVAIQFLWAVPVLIGVADLWFGLGYGSGSGPGLLFRTIGIAMIVVGLALRSQLALRLADGDGDRWPLLLRTSLVLAGRFPLRTLAVVVLDLACGAAGFGALIALPVLGCISLVLQLRALDPGRRARVRSRPLQR